jgi:hypothetical protein
MASCKNSSQTDKEVQEEIAEEEENIWEGVPTEEKDTRPFKARFDETIDLMDIAWKNMMASDNAKIRHSQKIVAELTKSSKFKQQKLADEVMNLVAEIQNSRYDKQSMTDAQHMETYDKTLDELILAVQKLKKKTKKFDEQGTCQYEYSRLMESNQQDAILRGKHDNYAKMYNEMLTSKKTEIEKLGENYQNLEKEPVFNYGD